MLTSQKIKLIKSLSLKKNRVKHGLFAVEGEKCVGEFIDSDGGLRRSMLLTSGRGSERYVFQRRNWSVFPF